MAPAVSALSEAVRAGADAVELESCPLPETYRAAFLRAADQEQFAGLDDKDVRRSIHIGDVPMPELAPDEVLVAVMAAAVNYNTVGSQGANYQESVEANRLLELGLVVPAPSRVHPFEQVAEAARSVQLNAHAGKMGVLVLAPREGLGVEDPLLREQIGEEIFRDHADDSVPPSVAGL